MKYLHIIIFFFFFSPLSYSQSIEGVVLDKYSQYPLAGVKVYCDDSALVTMTNDVGEYTFDSLSLSKHKLIFLFDEYEDVIVSDVEVMVKKVQYINVDMQLKILTETLSEVKIVASKNPNNTFASVSTYSFTPSLANKFAGGLGDPSRLTYNFPNVVGFDDSRNDIIIRSNSPASVLWRIEGVNVPNPNHFGQVGATGGAVTILNIDFLKKTDFYTGGFPSEFGNVVGGVFDLRLRNGNKKKHKIMVKNGWNGLELGVEGPLSKEGKGSFWVNYRYSFLDFLYQVGVPLDFHPAYQDLSFKINQPLSKKVTLGIFGIGGFSSIEIVDNLTDNDVNTINAPGDDLKTSAEIGLIGITSKILLNKKTTMLFTIGTSISTALTTLKENGPKDVLTNNYFEFHGDIDERRIMSGIHLNKKINYKNSFKMGLLVDKYLSKILDSAYVRILPNYESMKATVDTTMSDNAYLAQYYMDYQYRINDNLSLNMGLNYSHFLYNNSLSINPRLGVVYESENNIKFSTSYSHHSQLPPLFILLINNPSVPIPEGNWDVSSTQNFNTLNKDVNKNVGFTKAHHGIVSLEMPFLQSYRFKSELYYQYYYDVPVQRDPSFFSMLNYGGDYRLDRPVNLVNAGTGYNYGIDVTLEKVVKDGYYFLLNGSLSDSKYRGSDNVLRRTKFANIYLFNGIGGYSFKLREGHVLDFNLRCAYSGGRKRREVNLKESKKRGSVFYDDAHSYENKLSDYFRLDLKLSLQHNYSKVYIEWGVEVINLTNYQNVLGEFYNEQTNTLDYTYQSSFLVIPYGRVYF